ncbi:MAG: hypothetical protein HQL57_02280 [Magnetococcales bacterium]|nr:hypothetical protein [Magnetococcales bacterium]MBF0155993.1 hypothetical protein [Magnetococcales bacterium]
MKRSVRFLPLSLLLVTPVSALAGTQVGDFDLTANVALTSDYVWRGVSQNDEHPALQGGFDVTHKLGIHAGVWGSPVDFNDGDDASTELDFLLDYTKKFDFGLAATVGAIHYDYPGATSGRQYDFEEYYIGLVYPVEQIRTEFSAKYSYSGDFFGSLADRSAEYIEGGAKISMPWEVALTARAGHTFGDHFDNTVGNPDSYTDYKVGVSREFAGFGFDVSHYGTDDDGRTLNTAKLASSRTVFTLSKLF